MKRKDSAKGIAWDSFSKTGKIGYYLFYKALSEYGENGTEGNRHNAEKNGIS